MRSFINGLWRVALVAALTGLPAQGAAVEAIFTSAGLGARSEISGLTFDRFDRPVRSNNGQHWALQAFNTSANDSMYITGSGNTGFLRLQENVTEIEPGRNVSTFNDRRLGINDSGQWAVQVPLTGDAADNRVMIRGEADGTFGIQFREGQALPAAAGIPGAVYGATMFSVGLTNGGAPTYGANIAGPGITGSNDATLFLGDGSVAAREGLGTYQSLSTTGFWTNADGTRWLNGAVDLAAEPTTSDAAIVVDGAVVLQEGSPLDGGNPALGNLTSSFYLPRMESNGDWFTTGRTDNGTGYAIKNGAIAATTGDLVPGGVGGERWSSDPWTFSTDPTFFFFGGNNNGDTILGGFTDNASSNWAFVLNNSEVVVRSGDQVDLNGDGVLDDAYLTVNSLFSASPGQEGAFLTDDLWLYFNSDLVDASGAPIGEAFLRVRVPEPASAALLGALLAIGALRRR